jgi:hypothetical protein
VTLQWLETARATPKALTVAVLTAVLLLRVLIPQGWMPVETERGWQITICTGTGPMEMTLPAVPGEHHQDHAPGDHPCTFAGFALALDRAMPPMLALPPVRVAGWLIAAGRSITIGRGLAAPPPPATGPPGL